MSTRTLSQPEGRLTRDPTCYTRSACASRNGAPPGHPMLIRRLALFWRYRDLVVNVVRRDLQVRYKGSTLGFAWSLAHPLVMAAVYTLAFRYVIRVGIPNFPLFLLAGLMPWMFLSSSLNIATASIVDNGALVRKVAFPRALLPLSAVASQFVQFVTMYGVIVPVALALGVGVSWAWLALLPMMALQLLFVAGLGLGLSTAYVYFRDTRHLVEVFLQVWFWLTPIVYAPSFVPERFRGFLRLNPMTPFVTSYQTIVLEHRLPPSSDLLLSLVLAVFVVLAGLQVFARHEARFAERV